MAQTRAPPPEPSDTRQAATAEGTSVQDLKEGRAEATAAEASQRAGKREGRGVILGAVRRLREGAA